MGSRIGLAVAALVCAASAVGCSASHGTTARPTASPSASTSPSPRFTPGDIPTPTFSGIDGALASALSGACNSAPQVCASFMAGYTPSPSR